MRVVSLIVIVGAMAVSKVSAQGAPERRLTTPDAKFAHEFSAINGIRELPDGRVLVSDGIDQVVLRVDMKTGRADTLGRTGQGPGEYKGPDALYALPNGGTLLVDLGNGRLDFLAADGKYLESTPIAQGNGPNISIVLPRAVDAQGRIYYQPAMGGPRGGIPDSATVVRWDRARSRYDSVARVKLPAMNTQSSGGANNQRMVQRPRPYPAQDTWNVGPDGRVAIARASEYRVDWVGPSGVTKGRAVAFTPVPIRDADKREWVADQANGLQIQMENRNGQMSMAFSRGGREDADQEAAIASTEWPATKPAFNSPGVWVTPEGQAWVERSVPAGSPRVMDVFDANGTLKERIVLPAGRRVAGFGRGVVYLRAANESDLQLLERYRR
ncbi:MAG TPA: hypothetical protein VGP80_01140 [Gemmatimonadales bacterium]|nr:hypothetical protein [Gemmatimonadales bacterium]